MARIIAGRGEETVAAAVAVLRQGGLVACPTETFYALAADSAQEEALQRLVALKGRPEAKPLLLLVADVAMVAQVAAAVPPLALRLMRAFWPGPLTLVLPARPGLPQPLTGGTGTIGVRQSGEPLARAVAQGLGRPITGTSANRSGQPPLTTAAAVAAALGTELDLILDVGPCPGGLPSTILRLTGPQPELVRAGAIPLVALESFTGPLAPLTTEKGMS